MFDDLLPLQTGVNKFVLHVVTLGDGGWRFVWFNLERTTTFDEIVSKYLLHCSKMHKVTLIITEVLLTGTSRCILDMLCISWVDSLLSFVFKRASQYPGTIKNRTVRISN